MDILQRKVNSYNENKVFNEYALESFSGINEFASFVFKPW